MSVRTMAYPEPRSPEVKHAASVEELLPAARRAVLRTYGTGALGTAKPGEKVLIATPPTQDQRVADAIVTAFRERGVLADAVPEQGMGVWPPIEQIARQSAADGWKEVLTLYGSVRGMFEPLRAELRGASGLRPDYRSHYLAYLREHPGYDGLYCKMGGPPVTDIDKENWLYLTVDDLLSGWSDFPGDVQLLIEQKIVEVIPRVQEVRISDPEGTEVWFSVTDEEAAIWAKGVHRRGHLNMYPYYASTRYYRNARLPEGKLVFPKMNGVIAGASGYYGFFPYMRSYVEDGMIVRIEGGGLYGELLRELLYRTKDVRFPGTPRPGYMFMNELSLGTEPKRARPRDIFDTLTSLPLSPQRLRSGVFHWGPGFENLDPKAIEWCKQNSLPFMHGWNYMTYFNTYEVRLRPSGEWVKLVDRGRVTSLDDPEVRALAARYGDPDALLREDWVPAVPGINYPGDYMRDYGSDPASWARAEITGHLPRTIGVAP